MAGKYGQIKHADPSRKVLVVDDSESMRALISLLLCNWGCDVIEAADGEEALEIIRGQRISFVVTDWLMPRKTGVELCETIRSEDFGHYVYMILVTAKNSKEDLLEGMASGADDFLSKPIDTGELFVRVSAGMRMLKLHDDMAQRNNELEDAKQRIQDAYSSVERDLEAAAKLQKSLLPSLSTMLPGATIESCYEPASHLAGDIFNYFMVGQRHIVFYCIDVSGHGVPAALLSVSLSKMMSSHPTRDGGQVRNGGLSPWQRKLISSPSAVIADLNGQFQADDHDDRYFTMIYGVLDVVSRKVRFAQAGHPCPLLLHASGKADFIGSGGLPVGMFADATFEDFEVQLELGDRLVLYTDGITECEDPKGRQFGDQNLLNHLRSTSHLSMDVALATLRRELKSWSGTDEFADDVSAVALQIDPLLETTSQSSFALTEEVEMLMDKYKQDNVLVLSPQENRLDALAAVDLKEEISGYIESGENNIVLDLSKIDFIDSSGLGALVSLLKRIGRDGDLSVTGLKKATESMFQLTRMDKVFSIFPSVSEAIAGMRH